ncbi:enhanced intracellular survival protein Eis [Mycobacterium sp. SMC-8]|uniref:enhanced intracellular survival protein Eis n=1 Tax=Mycobacterium sp. SMC-8 TaxID=2857060 RepID=UPI0021B21ADB|nr:enhanced intracellular survival protein Eis [Mycobacterium sp. SMC-8]UXA13584.1 enhanced intracellular survival protein Eis [Mycobacterium sp. SMC-8]
MPHSPTGLTFRTAHDADWPAMALIGATGFGVWQPPESSEVWRSLVPADGAVVACDGPDVVGVALILDLELTVPGGAVLPMAGVSFVAVAPTHRRRGVLTGMFGELHRRMGRYPIAGLEASEAEIYGRFGYGPATVWQSLSVDRTRARVHRDVPDPGGVRIVRASEHRADIEDVYERWRLQTPGGLRTPTRLWDEVFADREHARNGGSALFCLLHPDGFAMYRVHSGDGKDRVEVTKLAAVTEHAYIAVWRVLLGLDLMATVDVEGHPHQLLPYLLTNPRLVRQRGSHDGLWLRMLDIPAVLRARTYSADLAVVLEVSDDGLGGGGRFALEVRDGSAHCVPTDAAADVQLDLSVLGSLYLGAHRASAFVAAGRLRCGDPALLAALDAAFATEVPAELGFNF